MNNTCYILLLSWLLLSSYFSFAADHRINPVGSHHNSLICPEKEREALLKFKEGIQVDLCGLLTTWEDDDDNKNCCHWHGIQCSNRTGNVIKLVLPGVFSYYFKDRCLQGNVSSSLVDLKHLTYLDLSFNYFHHQPIPTFINSLSNLKHLNLSYSGFKGEIPNQLGNLSRLISLDLSSFSVVEPVGDFGTEDYVYKLFVRNLSWLSRLTYLSYINLSGVDLGKATNWLQIISNLPHLKVLYLDESRLPALAPQMPSYQNSSTTFSVISLRQNYIIDNSIFQWLFNLSAIDLHLTYLDLSYNQLKGPIPTALENLRALSYLALYDNKFQGTIPSSFGNMQSLSHLDLGANQLESPIPDTISNIKPLTHLLLYFNKFQFLPKTFGNLCSLQELALDVNNLTEELQSIIQKLNGCASHSLLSLSLSQNQIWGPVPNTIDTFSSLRYLSLEDNLLNGTISQSLGNMSMLESLDLSSNSLEGTLSGNHFSNLSRLTQMDLSYNSALLLNIDTDWVPPFQLDSIKLSFCRLGPMFPKWVLSQKNYSWLDISYGGISDRIPKSFWMSLPSKLNYLDMSHNKIYGTLPDLQILVTDIQSEINLSFNNIEGTIPSFPKNVTSLFLNNNKFSNPIPFLCPKDKLNLQNLNLSNNLLSGKLPDCWAKFDQLLFLNLENNRFSGSIPASFGYLKKLQSLHLSDNSFLDARSVTNCTSLVNLDLARNSLSGHIPTGIGEYLRGLTYLSLRSNHFYGGIPSSLCQLSSLQILDLSTNRITGTIPKCISNLTAMQNGTNSQPQIDGFGYEFLINGTGGGQMGIIHPDAETVMWKKTDQSLKSSVLGLARLIDLSNNKLEGEIPLEISSLVGLVALNLSRNHLHGNITAIGYLTSLDALDLSNNHLSGKIPTSLADINSLGILDLSNNHFSGKIPTGPQLQTFDASSYEGNPGLCGMPLPKCPWDQQPDNNPGKEDKSGIDDFYLGLYISVVLGFIIGFWGVCGTLVLKRSWRHAFFRFFGDMKDKLYVMVTVNIARIRRRQ